MNLSAVPFGILCLVVVAAWINMEKYEHLKEIYAHMMGVVREDGCVNF